MSNEQVARVTTYGVPSAGGGRISEFTLHGLVVQVKGDSQHGDATEEAYRFAGRLLRGLQTIVDLDATIATLEEEKRRLQEALKVATDKVSPVRACLLGRGFVRFQSGQMWILSRLEEGFGAFGYRCEDWDDLFRRYNVRVVDHGTDGTGAWWAVENAPATGAQS